MNKATTGTSLELLGSVPADTVATCPTCDSPIPRERYDRILRIGEARQRQFADERAAIEREREAITRDREATTQAAVAAEQARAKVEEEARILEAKRIVEDQQGNVIDALREQLKTLEQRRRRDEEMWKETIVVLQQKADARDRAHFGPEGEEELVQALHEQFPDDRIEHRGKGGDVLHTVIDAGKPAGVIVYEVKKTRTFERAYVRQTKLAMETHGTTYGFLVSRALPARRSGLCVVSGVIVVEPALAATVAAVMRDGIVSISRLRLSEDGKAEKTNALFEYLRSQDFTAAIQRIQERLAELRESLTRERSFHDGWWSSREQQYAAILREAAGIDARIRDLLSGRPSSPV